MPQRFISELQRKAALCLLAQRPAERALLRRMHRSISLQGDCALFDLEDLCGAGAESGRGMRCEDSAIRSGSAYLIYEGR
jgi:hypothetical protein